MSQRVSYLLIAVCMAVCCLGSSTAAAQEKKPGQQEQESDVWNDIQGLYERAKEAGEAVPTGIYEWIHQDLQRAGDWEYRIVSLPNGDMGQLESALNGLGDERWDCFWVQSESRGRTRFFLKRPKRSYLKAIPLSDLLRFLPQGE